MLLTQTLRSRSRASLGLALTLAAGAIIMTVNLFAGLLLLGLALLGFVVVLAAPLRAMPRRPATARLARATQRTIYAPDGAERPAIVVPVESLAGYQLVLTSAGYRLVNNAGEVVYALK